MANPFEKRATEHLRDDEAFLAVVTPEPLLTFFEKKGKDGSLYDHLTMVIGTPGSGKTTLARLFQFTTLSTLLRSRNMANFKPLVAALTACRAVENERPNFIGARLPLEAEYRDFWEFPYPDSVKANLMLALLQARTVLNWLRSIQASDISLDRVEIVPRTGAEAALSRIGGKTGPALLQRAREVELAIYDVSAALVPPEIGSLPEEATAAYRPFDVIDAFRIGAGTGALKVRPLVIFDDAHSLHDAQRKAFLDWLSMRELRVSRWVLTRLDALRPHDVLLNQVEVTAESTKARIRSARDVTVIRMQSNEDRSNERLAFRKMAKGMARRYLGRMEVFSRAGHENLGDLLSVDEGELSPSNYLKLGGRVNAIQHKCGVSAGRRVALEKIAKDYVAKTVAGSDDLLLGVLSILFERYAKRIPHQNDLLDETPQDAEPNRPLTVDAGVAEGARVHLLHQYERPLYFGIDTLCDASSENAEQFLQLAGRLVSHIETRLVRRRGATLSSRDQHKLLRDKAKELVDGWSFPQCELVRQLANGIACECLRKSLEGNASLDGGATAFGLLREEFEAIPREHPRLAQVLQFGVAYNAFTLVRNHRTKGRDWCLVELGGLLLVHHGLTLKRGGFLQGAVDDLVRLLDGN